MWNMKKGFCVYFVAILITLNANTNTTLKVLNGQYSSPSLSGQQDNLSELRSLKNTIGDII